MKRWVWLNAWDVDEPDPAELIGELQHAGLNGCSIGLSYHGGRMLLARHPSRVVYEHHPGALYFAVGTGRFPPALKPHVSPQSSAVEGFLKECARRGFDAQAWLVLCHNDALAAEAPHCSVENAFGEKYSYALCPANEEVQEYCVELCRQAAHVEGIRQLDLEALSFMGYEHAGLHDKRGAGLPPEIAFYLSICCCPACRSGAGDIAAALRERIRSWLDGQDVHAEPAFDQVLSWRRTVQKRLLTRIREAVPETRLNLRLAQDARFSGGKSTLALSDLPGLADEATVTFFGVPPAGLARLPAARPVPVNGGVDFHGSDCNSEAEVRARIAPLREASLSGWGFYGFSMATRRQWRWLAGALQGEGL